MLRLGEALRPLGGIESANANLMGRLSLAWDEEQVDSDTIIEALRRAGFRPAAA